MAEQRAQQARDALITVQAMVDSSVQAAMAPVATELRTIVAELRSPPAPSAAAPRPRDPAVGGGEQAARPRVHFQEGGGTQGSISQNVAAGGGSGEVPHPQTQWGGGGCRVSQQASNGSRARAWEDQGEYQSQD